jgi:TolB-like protein
MVDVMGAPDETAALQREDRLDSWKEIAGYLKRDTSTVQRWEKAERLPIHRHQHDRLGSIYAFKSEIDSWLGRRSKLVHADQQHDSRHQQDVEGVEVLAKRIRSLVVLPLVNLSDDRDQGYFVDGLTDALITALAQMRALRVISRTSAMCYKDRPQSLPAIAKRLNVDGAIEGSVSRSGERVRVTVQLIHAATDTHVWASSYERDLRDALVLQSEVACAIADEIRIRVTADERSLLSAGRSLDSEAHEAYLRGRHFLHQTSESDFQRALKSLQRRSNATRRLRPRWRRWPSLCCPRRVRRIEPADAFAKVRAAAVKAHELEPTLADVQRVLLSTSQSAASLR